MVTKIRPATWWRMSLLGIVLSSFGAVHAAILPYSDTSLAAVPTAITPRATCKYVLIASGDSCWSIATDKCKISTADFYKYNGGSDAFCNSIKPGNPVCCSSGTVPNPSPQPQPDGTCATYEVKKDDGCWAIADSLHIKTDDIEQFNKKTWGWSGCSNLQVQAVICVSAGKPPMPKPLKNAVCGPQVAGTQKPSGDKDLALLNPCPLNACCNIWGQCGTTSEFCTKTKSPTGAPGTAAPGTSGCISNCGTDIINNSEKPSSFGRIAYFESWNSERRCLGMGANQIDKSVHTHVHYAFASITNNFQVEIPKHGYQFEIFVRLEGIKRILSFGGWSFSTEADTFPIFRKGVTDANRLTFAQNVVNFIVSNKLDGVDFDWEYPGAPDIEGVPPGDPDDGKRYLAFLKAVRERLPAGKSLSIAAPASFWYLKGFPIADIAKVVDYIVYMTYDLHGQWDVNNKWSSPGCETGNCLRSHINITETKNALSMVTKAGVPAKKIYVGITSYGRSFKMAEKGCKSENCKFLGTAKDSPAEKGFCTNTSGYISNAEIRDIIRSGSDPDGDAGIVLNDVYHDDKTDSDILVYNDVEWVAYMNGTTKEKRVNWVKSLNFGGVSDWAVDLWNDGVSPDREDDVIGGTDFEPCDLTLQFKTMEALNNAKGGIKSYCYGINALKVLSQMLVEVQDNYKSANNGYDEKFGYYTKYYRELVPTQIQDCTKWTDGGGECLKYLSCTWSENGNNFTTSTCPYPGHKPNAEDVFTMYYGVTNEEGLFKTLSDKYGIAKEWVTFGDREQVNLCHGAGPDSDCSPILRRWKGEPQAVKDFDVPNPKDVIAKAGGGIDALQDTIMSMLIELTMGTWGGSSDDLVASLSLPVFMITQAVESMKQVKDIGQGVKDKEKKALIFAIVSAVLFAVPFVGELGAAAFGALQVARSIALVGEAANVALSVAELVEDPTTAPMAIMGALLGTLPGGFSRTPKGFQELATARRGADPGALGKLGSVFKKNDDDLQKLIPMKACKKP